MPERAEIEAVARALLHKGIGSWDEQSELRRSYLLKQAEKAIEALDRVRDARGDDEVQKAWDEGRHPFGPGTGQAVTQTRYEAARSPQGENHEAGIEAALDDFLPRYVHRWEKIPNQAEHRAYWRREFERLAPFLSRVSPSREARATPSAGAPSNAPSANAPPPSSAPEPGQRSTAD